MSSSDAFHGPASSDYMALMSKNEIEHETLRSHARRHGET
jgi:hypothetical protein